MKVFRTLQKRGLQASLCKLKRRVLLDDRQATARLDLLGAYDYMKRYTYAAREAETATAAPLPAPHPGKIWTCWLQGLEQAPFTIKRCMETMRAHHADDLMVLTDENIPRYVDMPEHITRKRAQGIINNTAYSDILRLLLLNRHGGVWLDGTTWLLGPVPDYIRQADLFMFRNDNSSPSVGVIAACPHHPIIARAGAVLLEYWRNEHRQVAYSMAALALQVAVDSMPETLAPAWRKATTVPNNKCLLLEWLFSPYDPQVMDIIRQQCVIQQLSWKPPKEAFERKGTFYDVVVRGNPQPASTQSP